MQLLAPIMESIFSSKPTWHIYVSFGVYLGGAIYHSGMLLLETSGHFGNGSV